MSLNLNIERRKVFSLGELFEYSTSNDDYLSSYNNWNVEYVSSSSENNWVSSMIDAIPSQKWNTLTIARNWSVWTTFYHQNPYCASSDDIRILTPKFNMNQYTWLFLSTIINKESFRFNYGRKLTKEKVLSMKIKIPANESWNPDREYMENYVKSLHHKPITTKNKPWKYKLNIWEWKEFKIWDLFETNICKSEDLWWLWTWEIPFLWRTNINNWIQWFVDSKKITKWNCISVSMVWTNVALRQEDDFVASQNIATLRRNISKFSAIFICSLLNFNFKYKYCYWRTIKKKYLENTYLQLPVDKSWNPDREFMENYIKNLPYWDRI